MRFLLSLFLYFSSLSACYSAVFATEYTWGALKNVIGCSTGSCASLNYWDYLSVESVALRVDYPAPNISFDVFTAASSKSFISSFYGNATASLTLNDEKLSFEGFASGVVEYLLLSNRNRSVITFTNYFFGRSSDGTTLFFRSFGNIFTSSMYAGVGPSGPNSGFYVQTGDKGDPSGSLILNGPSRTSYTVLSWSLPFESYKFATPTIPIPSSFGFLAFAILSFLLIKGKYLLSTKF